MPELGESVTEGTVTRWLKKVGDSVALDEPLVEVSTDKVDTEIPSPAAGTLLSITAEEDVTVSVGGELGKIGAAGAAPAPAPAAAPPAPAPPAPAPAPAPAPHSSSGAGIETRTPTGTAARSRPGSTGGCGRRNTLRHPAGAKAGCRERH